MTQRLDQVIGRMRQLPAAQQDQIAALIEAELADDERWATAFTQPQDLLADWADEALQDHRAGGPAR
ncbi:MAG TPA: hypothetical protein VEL76_00670 [Gemmataceae bacterium]|nr:hypothetical protein [Gemmataceae bacterium]